jgi:hypothetical protein
MMSQEQKSQPRNSESVTHGQSSRYDSGLLKRILAQLEQINESVQEIADQLRIHMLEEEELEVDDENEECDEDSGEPPNPR